METASESIGPHRDDVEGLPDFSALELTASAGAAVADRPLARPARRRRARRWSVTARRELLWVTVLYATARGLLLLAAFVYSKFGHHDFLHELANWDGLWYRELANHGYPAHVVHHQSTLGFFPLYPVVIWMVKPVLTVLTGHGQIWASTVAGMLISGVGGLVTTVFVHRLAEGWWGRETARRAVVLFIVFPGSVVFSMVYSEGLLLPLAAACMYALERRRWLMAGIVAGIGTAVQPIGLVLPVMCLSAVALELSRHGWRASAFRRSLIAPILSGTGALAFMAFLWAWTGSPFANYIVQHHSWGEKTDPLALVHTAVRMVQGFNPAHFNDPTINLNLVIGVVGALVLFVELWLVWRSRREISVPGIVWTLGIAFFACTSEYVPPNPRLLLTAFPALMVIARWVDGKWQAVIVFFNVWLLVVLSLLTFYGHVLRP